MSGESEETLYSAAFYDQQELGSLRSAKALLSRLATYYVARSVLDVGCGRGTWLRAAVELGAESVLGLDGDYVDRARFLGPPGSFKATDLSVPFTCEQRFDVAICVEVAEHLPPARAASLIADIARHSDVVVFGAAIPYQGGTGHLNEQWPEYWGILFRALGYVPYDLFRSEFWSEPSVDFWYSQNTFLFVREGPLCELFPKDRLVTRRPMSVAHPLTFLINVGRCRPLAAAVLEPEVEDWRRLVCAFCAGDRQLPRLRSVGGELNSECLGARTQILDYAVLDAEVSQLRSERDIVRAERERLLRDGERLHQELRAVLSSTSWQLTKPLRWAIGGGRRLARVARRVGHRAKRAH